MILSASEMLAALVGQPVEYTVDGLGTVRVRGLTMLEYERLRLTAGQSEVATLLGVVEAGMVEPKLTREELEQAALGSVELLRPVFTHIMALSANVKDDEEAQASFGGGGS